MLVGSQISVPPLRHGLLHQYMTSVHDFSCCENQKREKFIDSISVNSNRYSTRIKLEQRTNSSLRKSLRQLLGISSNEERRIGSGCFVVLTVFQRILAVPPAIGSATGTAVPNACMLTDLRAGSSIGTRIVFAAAVGTRDVIST